VNKSMIAIGALLALSGCWWDDAPETYQGTATLTFANGEAVSEKFECDFRAQQATRSCKFVIPYEMASWVQIERKPVEDTEGKGGMYRQMFGTDQVMNELKARFGAKKMVEVTLDAHARKEGRYLLLPLLGTAWRAETPPSATREGTNYRYYIAQDEQLLSGWSMSYAYDNESYLNFVRSITQKGVWDFFEMTYSGPDSASLAIQWEPVPAASLSS